MSSEEDAQYLVILDYGIDSGQTAGGTLPIYGQTGGGFATQSGTVSSGGRVGSYTGSSYTPPTFGVIGAIPYDVTTYTRAFAMDIVNAEKLRRGVVEKLFEGRVISKGTTASLPKIVPYMIEALFKDFPGPSGETRTIDLAVE